MTAMITLDEVTGRVRQSLRGQFGEPFDQVSDDDLLAETMAGFDSLAAMECVSRMEEEFHVEVDFVGHDVRYHFATVARISSFVRDLVEDSMILGGR
jgi:acyl carrier protein